MLTRGLLRVDPDPIIGYDGRRSWVNLELLRYEFNDRGEGGLFGHGKSNVKYL